MVTVMRLTDQREICMILALRRLLKDYQSLPENEHLEGEQNPPDYFDMIYATDEPNSILNLLGRAASFGRGNNMERLGAEEVEELSVRLGYRVE